MPEATTNRWVIGAIVALCIVALVAWARNDPGVDDRDPDPPTSNVIVAVVPVPPQDTPVVTTGDTEPPTT